MIDLLDPELVDRDAVLDALPPVAWREGRRGPGYWAVRGYPEALAVLRDPVAFTSTLGTRPEVRRTADSIRPLHNMDPPAHTELRRVATKMLGDAKVIDAVVARYVDAFGEGDVIAQVAVPIVSELFAAWLGIPDPIGLHADAMAVHVAGAAFLDDMTDATREAATRASIALEERVRGDRLLTVLVLAGLPTTIDAIGNALAMITERPANLGAAIDASLEHAPIQQFGRYATRDVELGNVMVRAGQQVIVWFGAANRDPRRDGPHVSFGAGPHRCVGAAFARRLLVAVMERWFVKRDRHVARGVRRASSYMNGYVELFVTRKD
ncbi:MAG: hypothetical protein QM831_39305 [Kofleriaceae bacterium]